MDDDLDVGTDGTPSRQVPRSEQDKLAPASPIMGRRQFCHQQGSEQLSPDWRPKRLGKVETSYPQSNHSPHPLLFSKIDNFITHQLEGSPLFKVSCCKD